MRLGLGAALGGDPHGRGVQRAAHVMATDAVSANDVVRVTYHDMGGTLHAATVRVTAKGGAKP